MRFISTPLAGGQEPTAADQNQSDYAAAIERLSAAIAYEMEDKQLPGFSIALVADGKLLWAEGFGFQDREQTIPATADTVYRVGSVSKLFTDMAVMQRVQAGELDLDTSIQQYLPDFALASPQEAPITLRQLMSHRSGMVRESPVGNYFDPSQPTLQATVASLRTTDLTYPTDTRTKYSNAAIAVVGAVLESLLQTPHAAVVEQQLFQPLGMERSSFLPTEIIEPHLAEAWMWTYDGRRFPAPTFLLGTGPAGNMYSSVNDLSGFLMALFQDLEDDAERIMSRASWQEMLTPIVDEHGKKQGFGLGFHVQQLDGYQKIGHGGAVYGFSTQLEALPERRVGVAAVASLDFSNGVVGRLADYALRLLIAAEDGQPLPAYPQTVPVAGPRAAALVGRYVADADPGTGSTADWLEISHWAGESYLRWGDYQFRLRSWAADGGLVIDDVQGARRELKLMAADRLQLGDVQYRRLEDQIPPPAPEAWLGLIGEYGWDHNVLYILEDHGQLYALIEWFFYYPLRPDEAAENVFHFPDHGLYHGERLIFHRDENGRATEVVAAEVEFPRRNVGTDEGATFQIEPLRPVEELRELAMAAEPPVEVGSFRESDLLELAALDPSLLFDIRYATTNNFLGTIFYRQPRAFLQRPAAEALERVQQRLRPQGLGLLIYDGYRPWYVTKMFWEATPESMRDFVANPARGSRHNRGCAVDLTLVDLATGQPIPMVAGYDEFSPRSFPRYPGGTWRQRWYRDYLRGVMEDQGFEVYEYEWWHFDYRDWQRYRIGNIPFEQLD